MNPTKPHSELIPWLGAAGSLAIVVGTMIGTGIFLSPGAVAEAAGSPGLTYAAWVTAGMLSLCGALVYTELGASIRQAGGTYAYLSRAFGTVWGFLYGWTHSVISGPASEASPAARMARFCVVVAAQLGGRLWGIDSRHAAFELSGGDAVALLAILSLTALNYFGLRMGGRVQVGLTVVKVGSLAGIVAAGLWIFPGAAPMETAGIPPARVPVSLSAFLAAIIPALWAYDGWAQLAHAGSEVKNPGRNVRRALVWGVILVGVLYVLFNVACLRVLPFAALAASRHVASDVVSRLAGSGTLFWVTSMMAVAALGSLNSSILTAARTPYAMARDGVFFPMAARVHVIRHTPGGALLFQGMMSSLFVLTGSFEELTSLFVFSEWLFYGMAGAALFRLRYREPDAVRPYRCWGYPWVPTLFVLSAAALTVRVWLRQPVRCSIGLGLILSGLLFHRYWRRRSRIQTMGEHSTAAGLPA